MFCRHLIAVVSREGYHWHMFDKKAADLLTGKGFTIGQTAIRTDGMALVEVNDTFMFETDADDLAHGRASLEDILKRNDGKIFPDAPR